MAEASPAGARLHTPVCLTGSLLTLDLPPFFTIPAVEGRPETGVVMTHAVKRRTPPGFSMILDSHFRPADACNAFMADETAGTWGIGSTWRGANRQKALADDLVQFMTWSEANGRALASCTSGDLQDYANAMARAVSFVTCRRLKFATRKRRVGTVVSFLNWAIAEGYRAPPGSRNWPREKQGIYPHFGYAAKARKSDDNRYARPFRTSDIAIVRLEDDSKEADVRPFAMKELARVFGHLGPAVFEADGAALRLASTSGPRRNRIAAETSYHTGMRLCEVEGIKATDIARQAAAVATASPWQPFLLTVPTKGGGTRKVVVPAFVWKALLLYLRSERSKAMTSAQRTAKQKGKPFHDHGFLFVNGTGSNDSDVGQPTSGATLSAAFTKAVRTEGLTRVETCFVLDSQTGEPVLNADGFPIKQEVLRARHTFHDLRHTFAVTTYRSEVARGNPEPWEYLRERLGHKSVLTTMDIYVRHVRLDEASLSDRHAVRLRMDVHALA